MKKRSLYRGFLLMGVLLFFVVTGCQKESEKVTINTGILTTGKWLQQNGTPLPTDRIYWRYRADGTGVKWNESTDPDQYIGEEESNMTFSWNVEEDVLTHLFRGEMGNQGVTRYYTVKSQSAAQMVWEDPYGDEITLVKQ